MKEGKEHEKRKKLKAKGRGKKIRRMRRQKE